MDKKFPKCEEYGLLTKEGKWLANTFGGGVVGIDIVEQALTQAFKDGEKSMLQKRGKDFEDGCNMINEKQKERIAQLEEWKRVAEIRDTDALRSYEKAVKEKAQLEKEKQKIRDGSVKVAEIQEQKIAQLENEIVEYKRICSISTDCMNEGKETIANLSKQLKTAREEAKTIIETDLCTPCRWKIDKSLEKLEKVSK